MRSKNKKKNQNSKSVHYVDNDEFYREIVNYHENCKTAAANGKERPGIPDSCAEKIMLIAKGLGQRPNFRCYSYIEEMIEDAIETCIKRFDSFDPNSSDNPFAYYTQICKNAFLARIDKENKENYKITKATCLEVVNGATMSDPNWDEMDEAIQQQAYASGPQSAKLMEQIEQFEAKEEEKKRKKRDRMRDRQTIKWSAPWMLSIDI